MQVGSWRIVFETQYNYIDIVKYEKNNTIKIKDESREALNRPVFDSQTWLNVIHEISAAIQKENITSLAYLFSGFPYLQSFTDWGTIDMTNITCTDFMFYRCSSLTSEIFDFLTNMQNVTSAIGMFYGTAIDYFDLSVFSKNLKNASAMLKYCSQLQKITCTNKTVLNVESIAGICCGCHNLENIIGFFWLDVSKVEFFDYVFSECYNLETFFPIKKWNVSSMKSALNFFSHCHGLKNLNFLSKWKPENNQNCKNMFLCCRNLKSIVGTKAWNMKESQSYENMFMDCRSLQNIGIRICNLSLKDDCVYSGMFRGCGCLKTNHGNRKLIEWIIRNKCNIHGVLSNCNNNINQLVYNAANSISLPANYSKECWITCVLDTQCPCRNPQSYNEQLDHFAREACSLFEQSDYISITIQ